MVNLIVALLSTLMYTLITGDKSVAGLILSGLGGLFMLHLISNAIVGYSLRMVIKYGSADDIKEVIKTIKEK